MPGDELHEEALGTDVSVLGVRRERTGPRHAAPKKPFLTRLHVPAGKAVAIAAMPSAVLLSMGVTPQFAYAKPLPKNPFGDGPCISQQDRADEEAQEEAKATEKAEEERKRAEAERKAAEEKARQEEEQESDEENTSGSGSGSHESSDGGTTGAGDGSSGGSGSSPAPEPSPSEEDGSGGLLGGVGDALGDLLGGGDRNRQSEPEPSDSPEASAKESSAPVGDTVDELGEGVEDTVGEVEDGLNDTTDKLPLPDGPGQQSPSVEAGEDEATDASDLPEGEDGDKAFPCVEEKKVDGKAGATPAVLPNQPWTLKASSLTIRGQDYEGVFNVRTANGETKQVLKFTADTVDIGDLHQIVQGPDGVQYHVRAAAGSTSTIRDSQVTLYTERLEGNLFGLIPITFDPAHPPPLNLPDVFFTDVTVTQAGQFGGTLTIPGLHSTITTG
ncbi:hypothetical protein N566_22600 [Streptomycetaceae bacterium MP113-05]|nr:hypothetical protein N566_22600 [Streptomycetaceae bacterium MP113-05]